MPPTGTRIASLMLPFGRGPQCGHSSLGTFMFPLRFRTSRASPPLTSGFPHRPRPPPLAAHSAPALRHLVDEPARKKRRDARSHAVHIEQQLAAPARPCEELQRRRARLRRVPVRRHEPEDLLLARLEAGRLAALRLLPDLPIDLSGRLALALPGFLSALDVSQQRELRHAPLRRNGTVLAGCSDVRVGFVSRRPVAEWRLARFTIARAFCWS